AACCTKTGDIVVRHNRIRGLVAAICSDAKLDPVLEKKGVLGPSSGRRPGDVKNGSGLCIDVAVTCSSNLDKKEPAEHYALYRSTANTRAAVLVLGMSSPHSFLNQRVVNVRMARIHSGDLFRYAARSTASPVSSARSTAFRWLRRAVQHCISIGFSVI